MRKGACLGMVYFHILSQCEAESLSVSGGVRASFWRADLRGPWEFNIGVGIVTNNVP